jgi:hypothetical protein
MLASHHILARLRWNTTFKIEYVRPAMVFGWELDKVRG